MAIGRSNAVPSFLISAGARLTVIRRLGRPNPLLRSAAATRSRPSRTDPCANPTIVNAGSADASATSARTSIASTPYIDPV